MIYLMFFSASPTTRNYLYYNNSSVFGHINTSNSVSSWSINSSGSASFPSLNVNGTASISTNLCISSSNMRTSTDKLNVSTTSTGPYMFFNDGGTLGTYNTKTSLFPWFIEIDGDTKFKSINLVNGGNILSNNSLNAYSNIITSVTSIKTLGLSNITVSTIVLEPYYDNTITINTPISLYRQYRNNSANSQLWYFK